ncbi:MAG TPA: 50S ribosomal protein L10 [Solirubrobacteraceae bacterium]|nr:50S ribosomal protein L10 [Solirubrobacteraceae bacterium]
MNREQKAATIEALAEEINSSEAVFAVDYRGISVPQAAELRTALRDADASFRVVKNSLTERAADQVGAESLKTLLTGPTALTFVRGDAALAAKAIADLGRATQLVPFKGGLMNGEVLDAEQIRSISRLPSREVLYGQLVGIVASPISGLVRTLNALIGGLAVALGQVQEKKASGEIPAGESPAPAAEPAADGPAAEESPAEEPAADESAASEPAGEAPAEDAPATETPAEDTTAEPVSVEEAPTEVPATDEQPEAEEAPVEEASTVDQAESASEPTQDDNNTDASAPDAPTGTSETESAEATKED